MRWMDRMNKRAELMGRMLDTIGAMDKMPNGLALETDLRHAAGRCIHCKCAETCQTWLDEQESGKASPPGFCPNSALFSGWLETN